MRIYSMTATFGKLEHAQLTFEPGLNVIYAPNEWGKSTWCAFLLAMLYGLDTRAKSTKTTLADKEHYAPWSGSPMSGRIDLCWEGRDITIERTTRGRIPMGYFRAYETETGVEIEEMNAANCGQMLLGVEAGVYRRAGFLRLADLPAMQDDALRRRLNALVTTGDESGDGARLERSLRELKNRCRFNRTGLLPQAEQERDSLLQKIQELDTLTEQYQQAAAHLEENARNLRALENHAEVLKREDAHSDAARVAEAKKNWDLAQTRLDSLEAQPLPSREEAQHKCEALEAFRQSVQHYQQLRRSLPTQPPLPNIPGAFLGMDAEKAQWQVEQDTLAWNRAHGLGWLIWILLAIPAFAGAGVLLFYQKMLYTGCAVAAGIMLLSLGIFRRASHGEVLAKLQERYGSDRPEDWKDSADTFEADAQAYIQVQDEYQALCNTLKEQRDALKQEQAALCGSENAEQVRQYWTQVLHTHEMLDAARREEAQTREQYEILKAMARPMPEVETDDLIWDAEETAQHLHIQREEHRQLLTRQGELRGRIAALGDGEALRTQLIQTEARIAKLEDTYAALTLAQQTLTQASAELQRRFAPRISSRAQALLSRLTGGRYDRLLLTGDMTLKAGAQQEDTLHDACWRSEGTIDQMYLALRLAVAEELTPEAPLVLDDALVRFDDQRLGIALDILKELSQHRQVLLFTCQEREQNILGGNKT